MKLFTRSGSNVLQGPSFQWWCQDQYPCWRCPGPSAVYGSRMHTGLTMGIRRINRIDLNVDTLVYCTDLPLSQVATGKQPDRHQPDCSVAAPSIPLRQLILSNFLPATDILHVCPYDQTS